MISERLSKELAFTEEEIKELKSARENPIVFIITKSEEDRKIEEGK